MAEAKNSFLKAKMNQDLDDRLLPNGEYRTAQNILVGKSEEDSVGTLENIKGNKLIAATDLGVFPPYGPAYIIGFLMDETNDRIYTFLTNWTELGDAPSDAYCSIRVLEVGNGEQYTSLVEGSFLNFSTRNNIIGVNLIEDLLFWTDNRNQPRKINVETARNNSTYYTKEDHISVAKYNPYLPIELYREEVEKVTAVSTNTITVNSNLSIAAGMTVLTVSAANPATGINANSYLLVQSVDNTSATSTVITLSEDVSTTIAVNDTAYFLGSTMTDKSGITTWPGDPNYLEDKFVRFAYRFKFDDNEYSIFSPFTQIAFIPKQKGYFINGDQNKALSSSVLDFFENGINDIELIIPLPDAANNIENSYKIKEIEILYKESDKLAVRILDTIQTPIDSADGYYVYSYQSRKPKTTIAKDQTTRVYDKVPVKAFAQSVAGNRVIYGNFQTKHTPPSNIGYNVSVQQKGGTTGATNFIEHPNHTLKQNRNYQVGFVLSDKFGRQSDVILSSPTQSVIDAGGIIFSGSTIYAEYIEDEPAGSGVPDNKYIDSSKADWRGNALFVAVDSPIQSTRSSVTGAPGLYADIVGSGFDLLFGQIPTINGNTYTFVVDSAGLTGVPSEGEYLKGEYIDYVEITSITGSGTIADPYIITTNGQADSSYLKDPLLPSTAADTKFSFTINPLGWYSYKIVVKQVEQEYYNVYLPSAVAGGVIYPNSTDTNANTTYLSLINDNINKIPRDLSEVGPDQRQYRSSVKLFGRVNPTVDTSSEDPATYVFGNEQFYPNKRSDTSTNIGQLETVLSATALSTENFMFQAETDPIVVRVSTEKQFGLDAGVFNTQQTRFQLAVYETDPFVSAIDIFWETASAGLISDLNADVFVGFEGPVGFQPIQWDFPESKEIGEDITTDFAPINVQGNALATTALNSVNGFTVTSGRGDVTSDFSISQNSGGEYKISLVNPYTFVVDSDEKDEFTFELNIVDLLPNSIWEQTTLSFTEKLTNVVPSYAFPVPSSPYYYINDTYTAGQTIHDFGDWANNARNNGDYSSNDGPGTIPNNTGLVWEITAGNSDGYFAVNPNTGVLTLTSAGVNAGVGTYCLDLKLTDASEGVGALSVTKSPCIVKGYPPINNGGSAGGSSSFWQPGGQCPGLTQDGSSTGTFIYYLSDNTIPNNQLPEQANNYGNDGTTPTPPFRMGDALDQGQMLVNFQGTFEVNQTSCDGNEYNSSSEQVIKFRIYYRTSSSSGWNLIDDLNNYQNVEGLRNGFTYTMRSDYNASTGVQNDLHANVYAAYGSIGEYCFVVEHGGFYDGDGNSPYLIYTYDHGISVVDLHDSTNPSKFSIDTSGSSTAICKSNDTTPFVYSSAKLPDYAEILFEDAALLTVFQPTVGSQYFPLRVNEVNGASADDKTRASTSTPAYGGHEITVNPILNSNGSKLTTASGAYAVIKYDHNISGCLSLVGSQPPNRQLIIT
jgi:hypothetical protein